MDEPDTSAEALLKAIEALPFTVADNLSFKCEYRGFQDNETGEVQCGMEKNGGDCICASRFEMADRIAASLKVHTAGLRNALAAERATPPTDVVERAAYSIAAKRCGVDLTREQWQRHLAHYNEMCAEWPGYASASAFVNDAMRDATAALSAIPVGAELPAGVVVPREMTEEMLEAASHAGLRARDLIRDKHPHRRGFADAEWLPAAWRAALSAIKGGEQTAAKPTAKSGGLLCPRCSQRALVVDDPRSNCMYCEACGAGVPVGDGGET